MGVNPDFKDLLAELSAESADFLIVGAHAVMLYTSPRYTKDLDIWVRPNVENAQKVHRALTSFGAPLYDLMIDDLAVPGTIFQIGIAPNRIDVITAIDGVNFDEAWQERFQSTYGGVEVCFLSKQDLIRNKRTAARPQDLLDVERLELSEHL